MPRSPMAPWFSWAQISFPVDASTATIDRFLASRYITPSTTIGLNRYVRMSPVGNVQATSSFATFDLLICLRAEYWDESEPPRYWRQVSNFGLPFCWALTSAMPAGSRLATTNRRTRTGRFLCMGMCRLLGAGLRVAHQLREVIGDAVRIAEPDGAEP